MTNQTIEQAVEELSKDWLFAGDEPKEDDFGIHKEFKDFLRTALQAQRDAGARDNNSIAIKAIEGYNQEKIELTRMMREVGNQEFYLQTEVKNRMEVVDSKIQALTQPTT